MISRPLRIRVWSSWACFTRPEFHVERVSYPVITPSAARGILEAILMKPVEKPESSKRGRKLGFRWHVLRIGVVREGCFTPLLRNELGYEKHSYAGYDVLDERTQRHSLILKEVEYLIEGAIEVTGAPRVSDEFLIAKYQGMFERRVHGGQCYHRPYLGCREFPCSFEWAENAEPVGAGGTRLTKSYGVMFRDFDFEPIWQCWPTGAPRPVKWESGGVPVAPAPQSFHAVATDGWIDVARIVEESGRRKVVDA